MLNGSLPRKYRAVPNSLGNVEQLHAAFVTPFDAGPRPRGLVHPVRPRGRQMEDVSGGPMGAIMSLRFLLGLRIGQHIRPTWKSDPRSEDQHHYRPREDAGRTLPSILPRQEA